MHFTVRMHPTRRLASWVAWNIDGLRLFPSDSISRSGESFRADPRIPTTAQTLNEAYQDNRLDRGHIARRSDLLWGTLAEARTANSDSFFFTNITPQIDDFNQSGAAAAGACWRTPSSPRGARGPAAQPVRGTGTPRRRPPLPRHRPAATRALEGRALPDGGRLRFKCFVLSQDLDRPTSAPSSTTSTPTSCRWTSSRTAPGSPSRACVRTHRPPNSDSRTAPVLVADAAHVDW